MVIVTIALLPCCATVTLAPLTLLAPLTDKVAYNGNVISSNVDTYMIKASHSKKFSSLIGPVRVNKIRAEKTVSTYSE